MTQKLTAGEIHFLRLIEKGQNCPDGWAPVSKQVLPLVKAMPGELVEWREVDDGRGLAMLKPAGQNLLDAMAWL